MQNTNSKPFVETKVSESVVIRTFPMNTDEMDLKWHWDEEDRLIEPLGENDWQFQFDNELPMMIYKQIFIPAGVIHRVIKGNTDLKIKIIKYETR
jgi:hypothetical protein